MNLQGTLQLIVQNVWCCEPRRPFAPFLLPFTEPSVEVDFLA